MREVREVREVMRLYRESGQPVRDIARRIGVARSTARDMIARFERSGLAWPVPVEMNDTALEARLYGAAGVKPGRRKLPEPDWSVVAREMKRKHVTMLWHHTMPVDGGIHINSSTPVSSVNRRHPYARTADDRSPSHTMTENRQSNASPDRACV